jgi:hypothetical protein
MSGEGRVSGQLLSELVPAKLRKWKRSAPAVNPTDVADGEFSIPWSHRYPGPDRYAVTVAVAPALGTHTATANTIRVS